MQLRQTDLIVLHHYHAVGLSDPRPFIDSVRAQEHRPVVGFTGGDAFFNGFFRPRHPQIFKLTAASADITFNTSMGAVADAIARYGAPRVVLSPNYADLTRFGKPSERYRPLNAEFDVCFVGSNNRSRNPGRSYYWYGRQRENLVRLLTKRFGARFAVFGGGWDGLSSAQGRVPFDQQLEACRRARVVVGGVPYSPARYYTSNRPYQQIMSGVPFVDVAVDGVDRLLRDGEHWHLVGSFDRVADRVDELLCRTDAERVELGEVAADYVRRHHSEESRWRQIVHELGTLRAALRNQTDPPPPLLQFMLPEVNMQDELPLATRGW